MSSSEEMITPRRDVTTHAFYGVREGEWGWKREVTSVPQPEEFPEVEPKPFSKREGVHLYQEHQPTLWKPRNSKAKKGNRTSHDEVLTTRTKMVGRANQRGWKPPTQEHPRNIRKRMKADEWVRNHPKN